MSNKINIALKENAQLIGKIRIPEAEENPEQPDQSKYILPIASETVLGGVKIGKNLKISGGVLSIDTELLIDTLTEVLFGMEL